MTDYKQRLDELVKRLSQYGTDKSTLPSQALTLAEELHAEVERLRTAADKMKEALANAGYHIDQLQHVFNNKDFSREEVVLMIANVFQAGEDATKALSNYKQARGGE